MKNWIEFKENFEKIKSTRDLDLYIEEEISQILRIIFFGAEVIKAKDLEKAVFNLAVETESMRIMCRYQFSSKTIHHYWKTQIPIISFELEVEPEPEEGEKFLKYLLIYVESDKNLEEIELTPIHKNIIAIKLETLLKIRNHFVHINPDNMKIFENLFEASSGLIYSKFIDNFLDFIKKENFLDEIEFSTNLMKLLDSIDGNLLEVQKEKVMKKYDFSERSLDIKFGIIDYLFKNEKVKLDNLADSLKKSKEELFLILDYLIKQRKVLTKSEDNYFFLTHEDFAFKELFNLVFHSERNDLLINLYKSKYIQEMINPIVDFIKSRFYLSEIDEKNIEEIKKVILLFPSTLNYCLNNKEDLTFFKHSSKNKQSKIYESFKIKLFSRILEDLFKNVEVNKKIFENWNILDYRLLGNLILLKDKKQFLDFITEMITSLIKLKIDKSIEAGTPIKLLDSKGLIGLLATQIELKDYKGAIDKSAEYLSDPKLEEHKIYFLINQGVAFSYLGKYSKAIENYLLALEIKEKPIIYKNLIHAWFNKYLQAIKQQKEYPLIIIKLLEYLHNAKLNLETLKNFDLEEKDKEIISNITNLENEINREFESFYKQAIKSLEFYEIPQFLFQVENFAEEYLEPIYKENINDIDKLSELEYNKLSPSSWNKLANIFKNLKKNKKAMQSIKKAQKYYEEQTDHYTFLDTEAEILYDSGKLANSILLFNKILTLDKDDIRVRHFYAESCWKAAKVAKKMEDEEKYIYLMNKACKYVDGYCDNKRIKLKIKNDCINSFKKNQSNNLS